MDIFTPANIRMWQRLGTCGAYGAAMCFLAERYDNIAAVTADLCYYSGLDRFRKNYPERFYNVGIAEQNMLGVAAGLASEGFNVFASTYATFAAARILDAVRVNMGYMKLPVKLVGLTAGFSVGILGATHMGNEDIAAIRAIPNIIVLSPADTTQTVKAALAAAQTEQPVYIRLGGVMGSPLVYKEDFEYTIGKGIVLREGRDVSIIAAGTMTAPALKAAELLQNDGVSARVVDMHTIKPLDGALVRECLDCRLLVTVEEHSVIGGLGAAVAEETALCAHTPPRLLIGIADAYPHADDYSALLEANGLTAPQIYARIKAELERL